MRTEELCPICDGPMGDNPALYAMGWHVTVCSNECQHKAVQLLCTFGPLGLDDYSGPDTGGTQDEKS